MAAPDEDKKNTRKKVESVRERAERAISEAAKPAKAQNLTPAEETRRKQIKLLGRLKRNKTPNPDKKPRRFHFFPKFIRNAFNEIKLVTWPDRITTTKLSFAVIIFATIFSILVSLVDYGFGHLFKRIFIHG